MMTGPSLGLSFTAQLRTVATGHARHGSTLCLEGLGSLTYAQVLSGHCLGILSPFSIGSRASLCCVVSSESAADFGC